MKTELNLAPLFAALSHNSVPVPVCNCPVCEHTLLNSVMLASADDGEPFDPKSLVGHASMCPHCLAFLIFNEDNTRREATTEEIAALPDHVRNSLVKLRSLSKDKREMIERSRVVCEGDRAEVMELVDHCTATCSHMTSDLRFALISGVVMGLELCSGMVREATGPRMLAARIDNLNAVLSAHLKQEIADEEKL